MPTKPLSDEQLRDAQRLKSAFKTWQSSQREQGLSFTQDEVAGPCFGFGQSALSQYLTGAIPLNAQALSKFCRVLGVHPSVISPSLVRRQRELAAALTEPDRSHERARQHPVDSRPGVRH